MEVSEESLDGLILQFVRIMNRYNALEKREFDFGVERIDSVLEAYQKG